MILYLLLVFVVPSISLAVIISIIIRMKVHAKYTVSIFKFDKEYKLSRFNKYFSVICIIGLPIGLIIMGISYPHSKEYNIKGACAALVVSIAFLAACYFSVEEICTEIYLKGNELIIVKNGCEFNMLITEIKNVKIDHNGMHFRDSRNTKFKILSMINGYKHLVEKIKEKSA